MIDATHDPERRSWVDSAEAADTDFPIQNLPFGVFARAEAGEALRVGVAIGDQIVDVAACVRAGVFDGDAADAAALCAAPAVNALAGAGRSAVHALRSAISGALSTDAPRRARHAVRDALVPMQEATLHVPVRAGGYTDFYTSIQHATNLGSFFRPDSPLLPNYKWVPIGYHGRASSIIASGSEIRRPHGQTRNDPDAPPTFGPSRRLDYELEVGAVIGPGNRLGAPISIDDAEEHLFGLCLVNDWSARDVQTWEYQPLGPFLAKSFATTISPWVVTLDALAPFRARAYPRPTSDPGPLPHLFSQRDVDAGGFDVMLEVWLSTERMRARGLAPMRVSVGAMTEMYWTMAQLVAHHTSNGCNLEPGDLFASGTISGPTPESRGSLIERAWRGTQPIALPSGELRAFLEDGDEVVFRGYCERSGHRRIGFGECRGRIYVAGLTSST